MLRVAMARGGRVMQGGPGRVDEALTALRGTAGALAEALGRLRSHRSNLAAAGCAFYATLALFPAMTLLLALYGLAFNLRTVEPLLNLLRDFVPAEAHELIVAELHALLVRRPGAFGLEAAIGAVLTLWSALSGTRAMLAALTLAYDGEGRPAGWRLELTGLLMTLAAVVAAALSLALLVSLPAVLRHFGLPPRVRLPVHGLSVLMLTGLVATFFAALYSFGPPLRRGEVRIAVPGTVVATLAWLAASDLFSAYVGRMIGLGTLYGPIGTTAGLMLWFYVSAWVVLLGAEINAALERRAERRRG